MSVWYAVVSSMAYMLYTAPYYEWSNGINGIKVVLVIVHLVTFFGGIIYDMKRQEKIEVLQREVKKLKERFYCTKE